ncbi:hypothetical protein Ahy_B03g064723 isoform C [Arachis hypogaea]|uniref:Aminotransferase-like plant mobile domain-containing protein n=2 Tax=Arachis hypogaea TaxID=3818 RepID=A0A445A0A9_ARAHY|nr:hypothetical protein Ahy_B03g064723 isoform C [Arachis hypogaea]
MQPTRCVYSVRRQQNMPLHDRIIPYLERAGLYHLARLNAHWFWLDEPLVSAFIERWRPETHTFHMPFGECTITLQDVAYQLGLPVDGQAASGCMTDFHIHIEGARSAWEWFEELFGELPPPDKRKLYTVHFTWFHDRFRVLPADASEETVRIYARAYIMMLLSTQLFMDKSANRVHLRWLPFVARLDDMGSYSWGAAALAWLYRCMCRVANRNVTNLAGPLQLLQSWIFWRFPMLRLPGFDAFSFLLASRWATYLPSSDGKERRIIHYRLALDRLTHRDIVWEPYGSLDVLAVIHLEILTEEHSRLWRAVTSLIYSAVIEWHQVDSVFPQLGGVQHLPEPALNIEYLHSKDGRGGDRWFPTYYRTWHQHWDERVCSVLSVHRVPDPGPSPKYLDWWHRVAHRILSPGVAFADPRPTQVPDDAILRGSSQAPTRVPASDMPDNRRLEWRRRIGTRATNRDWRWLDDMMQEEHVGGDDRGQADHRLRRSSARRRVARGGGAPPIHHGDEAGSFRQHPTDTHAGGTAEASMGGTPFTHVSSSQVLHGCSTQLLADQATTSFTMDLNDQLGGPQFYTNFAEIIRGDDVHQYQSLIPGGSSDHTEYRPPPADMPETQVPETQLSVDLNELAGSPYDTWFGMGGTPPSAFGVAAQEDGKNEEGDICSGKKG